MTDSNSPSHNTGREVFYDLLTLIFLLGSVVILGGTLIIVANPDVPFNPLPLPTLPSIREIPTATVTFTPTATLSPTATATPSSTPTETLTPTATFTLTATFTPSYTPSPTITDTPVFSGLPTETPDFSTPITGEGLPAEEGIQLLPVPGNDPVVIQLDAQASMPFTLSEPVYQANTNSAGCNWLSIAGSAISLFDEPLINLAVEVAGNQFMEVHFTGTAERFGVAGFEINVGNQPHEATFTVRLLGRTGEALSDYHYITTRDSCNENVVVVEFIQVGEY